MDAALEYKLENPSESYSVVADRFGVAKSTLQARHSGTHSARGVHMPRNLSIAQEDVLVDTINSFCDRGTLMTPKHIHQLAQRLCKQKIGINGTTTFLRRHKDRLSSRFYRVQELARLKANTPETRRAFLTLVSLSSRV